MSLHKTLPLKENAFETLKQLIKAAGFKNVHKFEVATDTQIRHQKKPDLFTLVTMHRVLKPLIFNRFNSFEIDDEFVKYLDFTKFVEIFYEV